MASGTIKNFANDSGSNYCKMPDGTLIQWGDATIQEGTEHITVNFPYAFINKNYTISAIAQYSFARTISFVYATEITTSIDIYHSLSELTHAVSFKWFAIGRWK